MLSILLHHIHCIHRVFHFCYCYIQSGVSAAARIMKESRQPNPAQAGELEQ
jgi:hypothetical protein